MHQLTIIGLGAGDLDQLALGTYRKLKEADLHRCADGPAPRCRGIKSGRNCTDKFR